jgi:hypothetical protein
MPDYLVVGKTACRLIMDQMDAGTIAIATTITRAQSVKHFPNDVLITARFFFFKFYLL